MKKNTSGKNHINFLNEAETLLEQNKFPDALNLAQERLRLMSADADVYVIAGSALIGMGRIDEARDILRDVGNIISDLSFVYDRIGDVYRKSGFHQDAAFCYEKFLSLHPGAEDARMVIEKMTLLDQEDHPVNEIDIIDENIPEPELFTVTLAELYIRQGHLPVARKILEEIIKKEPQNIQAAAKLDSLKKSLDSSSTVVEKFDPDKLIKMLSSWLKNVDRLKIHATNKKRITG
ncbi:MAG: tetratricopeptide repeat protein [Smithella sp.]|nr:tetratricopeptide repeat protein [Smithella sp.]